MSKYGGIRETVVLLTIFGIPAGCATMGNDLVANDAVKIEKVGSARGTIGPVRAIQEGEEVALSGEVRRRPFGRGPIPGFIDLEVLNPQGDVLEQCVIDYDRPSPNARYANFHAVLEVAPPTGSTIRVRHDPHVASADEQDRCDGAL